MSEWRSTGNLTVRGYIVNGNPSVFGQWGSQGLGYSTRAMREAVAVILAACDDADAMAARRGDTDG